MYDPYKAAMLARLLMREITVKMVEGMQAQAEEQKDDEDDEDDEDRVLGYDVLYAPNGDLCMGVRLSKKVGRRA